MYAVVKTGGKQYTVKPGDVIAIEKIPAEVGEEVELPVIFVADGDKIEADPEKAAATKVTAEILDQYKGKKQLVFKFKKRKGYKKLKGHRQQLTKVRITAIGDQKWEKKAAAPAKAEGDKAASEE
jgi:large subunit ribosomal protein L21